MKPLDAVVKFFGGRADAEAASLEASAKVRHDKLEIERAIRDLTATQQAIAQRSSGPK